MRPSHWLLGVLPLYLLACADDFAPYSQLDRLRILGIQAEPAMPLPGERATLSALTFAPGGERPALQWSWCPVTAKASDNYACPLDQAVAAQLFGPYLDGAAAGALPSLDLGTGDSASFANPFATAALAALCTSGLRSSAFARELDCDGGYPVTIVLDASTASASLRAGFVLTLPTGDVNERNRNPAPTDLALAGVLLSDPLTTVALAPGATVALQLGVAADIAEPRPIPPSEGPPGQRLERLTTSWFASSGEIDKARTAYIDGVAALAEMASNRFTAPQAAAWPPGGLIELAAVVRDDRGGEGWLVRRVMLEVAP